MEFRLISTSGKSLRMRIFLITLFSILHALPLRAQNNVIDNSGRKGLQKALQIAFEYISAKANPDTVLRRCHFNEAGSVAIYSDHKTILSDEDLLENPAAFQLRFDVIYGAHLVGSFYVNADTTGQLLPDDDTYDSHRCDALFFLLKEGVPFNYYDLRKAIKPLHLKDPVISFERETNKAGKQTNKWMITVPKLVRWHKRYYEVYYEVDARTGEIKKISQRFRIHYPKPIS